MGLLRFALKSSIAGGFVYGSVQEGLWSDAESSIKFYTKLSNGLSPFFQKLDVPAEIVEEMKHIPNPSDFKVYVATYYNKGVMASIKFLSELPLHVSNGINRIQQEIEKASKPTETPSIKEK